MPHDETRVTAEWALWGLDRRSGLRGVLAGSGGRFSRGNFAEIVHRYHTGAPAELPQVTIGWTRLRDVPYLTLAIETWRGTGAAPAGDSVTRVFCVPFAPLARARVSYESLYRAFAPLDPPADGAAATVVLPAGEPGKPPGGPAMGTAATLLSGESCPSSSRTPGRFPCSNACASSTRWRGCCRTGCAPGCRSPPGRGAPPSTGSGCRSPTTPRPGPGRSPGTGRRTCRLARTCRGGTWRC
ncbi:hypothetical protein ACFQY7_26385 [Actinomadura luteofluorescens]|uniref:hypothetical protein n=1 Tax=Actinomadura luteofluorescens TaxID=46163 RepID=UPI00363D2BDE